MVNNFAKTIYSLFSGYYKGKTENFQRYLLPEGSREFFCRYIILSFTLRDFKEKATNSDIYMTKIRPLCSGCFISSNFYMLNMTPVCLAPPAVSRHDDFALITLRQWSPFCFIWISENWHFFIYGISISESFLLFISYSLAFSLTLSIGRNESWQDIHIHNSPMIICEQKSKIFFTFPDEKPWRKIKQIPYPPWKKQKTGAPFQGY